MKCLLMKEDNVSELEIEQNSAKYEFYIFFFLL